MRGDTVGETVGEAVRRQCEGDTVRETQWETPPTESCARGHRTSLPYSDEFWCESDDKGLAHGATEHDP